MKSSRRKAPQETTPSTYLREDGLPEELRERIIESVSQWLESGSLPQEFQALLAEDLQAFEALRPSGFVPTSRC